jgi:hypothetical protein
MTKVGAIRSCCASCTFLFFAGSWLDGADKSRFIAFLSEFRPLGHYESSQKENKPIHHQAQ